MTGLTTRWMPSTLPQTTLTEADAQHLPGSARTDSALIKRLVKRINHANEPTVEGWPQLVDRFKQIANRNRNDFAVCFRHGLTKYNQRNLVSGQHDTVLSPIGELQAVSIAATLPPHIDLVVSSALSRTIQTMALSIPDSLLHSTPICIDPRLNEVNLGHLQGRRRVFLPEFNDGNIDYAPPHGESYRDAARRILSSVADTFDLLAHLGGPQRMAVIFCHAGVVRILSSLTGEIKTGHTLFHCDTLNAENVTLISRELRLPELWLKESPYGVVHSAVRHKKRGR